MTTPSPDPGTPTMTASIDGASWQAIGTASYSGGTLTVSGTGTSTPPQSIGFALVVGRPGTYAIGGGNTTGATAVLTIGSASWQSVPGSGSGTITIDTLTPAGVSGTFSFTATAVPGTTASGTKQVTTGAFNISY